MVNIEIRNTPFGYDYIKAEHHAEDPIVCAGVSAVMQGLCGTLLNLSPKPDIQTMIIKDGYVEVEVSPMANDAEMAVLDAVFKFAVVSLLQISKKYPQNVEVFHK